MNTKRIVTLVIVITLLSILTISLNKIYQDSTSNHTTYYYRLPEEEEIFKSFENKIGSELVSLTNSNKSVENTYTKFKSIYKIRPIDPNDSPNLDLSIKDKYIIELYDSSKSDYVVACRSNYPYTIQKMLDTNSYIAIVDIPQNYMNISNEFVLEYIVQDNNINNIPVELSLADIDKSSLEYQLYMPTTVNKTINSISQEIIDKLPSNNQDNVRSIVNAYIEYILDNYYYVSESGNYVHKFNNVNEPLKTIELKVGNCDDFAELLIALLGSVNIPSRNVSCSSYNETFETHENVEIYIRDKWYMLNPTCFGDPEFKIDVEGVDINVLSGLKEEAFVPQVWYLFNQYPSMGYRNYFIQGLAYKEHDYLSIRVLPVDSN